jgi:hypothetical protein
MAKKNSADRSGKEAKATEYRTSNNFTPEQYTRLQAEAAAPYRGLRKFVYLTFGASGLIGTFIFGLQAIAGRDIDNALPNLALQVGLVAMMVFLWRWDRDRQNRS